MNTYQAILAAADHIERNPQSYNFFSNTVPTCDTQGCMLGWVGHFMGMSGLNVFRDVCPKLGLPKECYVSLALRVQRIEDIKSATDAATILRRFAQRFKPTHTGIPSSIRSIFESESGERVS